MDAAILPLSLPVTPSTDETAPVSATTTVASDQALFAQKGVIGESCRFAGDDRAVLILRELSVASNLR
ncbi:MAG: hypothetical protein ABSD31_15030 [Candidatus Binataceae bacterium]|jgi:hypothetical protein